MGETFFLIVFVAGWRLFGGSGDAAVCCGMSFARRVIPVFVRLFLFA